MGFAATRHPPRIAIVGSGRFPHEAFRRAGVVVTMPVPAWRYSEPSNFATTWTPPAGPGLLFERPYAPLPDGRRWTPLMDE